MENQKRDLNLIRDILFEVEKHPYTGSFFDIDVEGYDEDAISYHVLLAEEANLIEAYDDSSTQGRRFKPIRLTNYGHDFLDAARNDSIWNKAIDKIKNISSGVSIQVLYNVIIQIINLRLGLME